MTIQIENGRSAFPNPALSDPTYRPVPGDHGLSLRAYAAIHLRQPDSGIDWLDGMIRAAKRDEIAGQALAGIMANSERWRDIQRRYDQGRMTYDDASRSNAAKALSLADAMLSAREDKE